MELSNMLTHIPVILSVTYRNNYCPKVEVLGYTYSFQPSYYYYIKKDYDITLYPRLFNKAGEVVAYIVFLLYL